LFGSASQESEGFPETSHHTALPDISGSMPASRRLIVTAGLGQCSTTSSEIQLHVISIIDFWTETPYYVPDLLGS